MAFDLNVNESRFAIDADPQTPLLWVIREHVGLTGTKFGCGIQKPTTSAPAAVAAVEKRSRRDKPEFV